MDKISKKPKNLYTRLEWAGAFGDIGTLIPFVVAYITIVGIDPLGLLFMFGISKIAAGFYYKTPIPIQPMKAIGAAAIAGGVSPSMLFGAGLTTGLFWLILGATGMVKKVSGLASKPVVRGIMLGLGLSFIVEGIGQMRTNFLLAGIALVVTYLLLTNPKIPAMFILLIIGVVSAIIINPGLISELAKINVGFKLPAFALGELTWNDIVKGTLIFTLPQIPLTLGNAVIAITAENNELFHDRPVTEKKMAISTGIMNIISPLLGGVPMCHGAGGMAGHVRFGARTGGALVVLGSIVIIIALFFSDSVSIIFKIFPAAILGVILFFAGAELALVVRDIGDNKTDFYVMLIVAGFAMWNMGVAFLVGVILDNALKRGWIKI
ncbi:MAG: sulfate transporter [Syntrophaceae bacterium CG2_30_49_12]|nr:MAG: sulfate transporter [Syntrophaceae bacterium CG2_30_49_12]PIP07305.1 MAG: sulfate transporter [Syntrophobacterales bacterium CG23_combo_of_CG06-09_8_20_14_all_48_27]PJA49322.1 MAG: sulfate transporter [Syntrophobacterales bacterium CG_4_9_14_3_um_filter_49_8]PJC75732.1 MAG: sulfate transporter [Syntrophobacterales bacterium CG_4_8_14_3_um_filter_49_14]